MPARYKVFKEAKHSSYARVGVSGATAAVDESGWLAEESIAVAYRSAFNELHTAEPKVTKLPFCVVPPKVFSDFVSEPGEAPRPLLVERKRREFGAKLESLPALIVAKSTPGTLGVDSMYALEHFDDNEFDIRTPGEWIALGGGANCALPAMALCCTQYPAEAADMMFEAVTVTGYNAETEKFTVVRKAALPDPESDKERKRHEVLGVLYEGTLQLHRLFVCFTVEDPERFAMR
jgi:hypothetical protein